MQSMNGNRMLGITNLNVQKSAEKLASGYKINRAGDDAAGLSISEKMRKQMRGLDRGVDNVSDGISFCQVADGALNEVCDMLNRIKVLAIQSANGTNSPSDRKAIDNEVQQLKAEAERVFQTTSFNDSLIWERIPDMKDVVENVDYYAVTINYSHPATELTADNVKTWPKDGFQLEETGDGVRFKWNAIDGNTYYSEPIPWPTPNTAGMSMNLKDHLSDTQLNDPKFKGLNCNISYSTTPYTTFDEVRQYVTQARVYAYPQKPTSAEIYGTNAVSASFSISSTGIQKSNINLEGNADTSFAGFKSMTQIGDTDTDSANKLTFTFEFAKRDDPDTKITVNAVPSSVTMTKWVKDFDPSDRVKTDDETRGENWGRNYFSNDGWWGKEGYTYPNGVKYYMNAISDADQSFTNFSASGIKELLETNSANPDLGGLLQSFDSHGDDTVALRLNYNLVSGNDNYGSFSLTLYGEEGVQHSADFLNNLRKITGADLYASNIGNTDSPESGTGTSDSVSLSGLYVSVPKQTAQNVLHSVLVGYKDLHKNIHTAPEADMEVKIFIDYACLSNLGLGIEDMNVLTIDNSEDAMSLVDEAARKVVAQRSLFGAYQNRLEHTSNNLGNIVENTTAAESRIRDTDMADEMVKHSMENILRQAGQSMLAQANQTTNGVMSLLQ